VDFIFDYWADVIDVSQALENLYQACIGQTVWNRIWNSEI